MTLLTKKAGSCTEKAKHERTEERVMKLIKPLKIRQWMPVFRH
ncbi:hypothetical protein [Bacillus pumilus]|nr:hypothetical protein [Bacillus pumilus]